jgi:hypothetical protein
MMKVTSPRRARRFFVESLDATARYVALGGPQILMMGSAERARMHASGFFTHRERGKHQRSER